MFVRAYRVVVLSTCACFALMGVPGIAGAQTQLPEVVVSGAKPKPKSKPHPVQARAAPTAPVTPAAQLNAKANAFDQSRSNIYTTIGTTSDTITQSTIDALPQGANQTVEKVLLQEPGVSQDSAASGSLHIRNDHANVQYRINGIMLPDGVTGFGSIFDTSFIGSAALITGALPAEFGMRTVGLVDFTTRADLFNNSGTVGVYGGSQGMITPFMEYGGTFGSNCPTTAAAPPARGPCRAPTVSPACNIISPAAICRPTRASKIRCRRIPRSTIFRRRKRALPTCRPSSTRRRA